MYLFIDTTKDMTVGLLNETFDWIEYDYYPDAKSSATIHYHIFNLLKKHQSSVLDVKALFQVAGPGSYTGMRVSEGITQIFQWQNFNTYSFYHFDIPYLIGHSKGIWLNNAFKGEYFIYRWDNATNETSLCAVDLVNKILKTKENIFTSFENTEIPDAVLTKNLIFKNSKKLFSHIVYHNVKKPIYYYRSIEEEYRRQDL